MSKIKLHLYSFHELNINVILNSFKFCITMKNITPCIFIVIILNCYNSIYCQNRVGTYLFSDSALDNYGNGIAISGNGQSIAIGVPDFATNLNKGMVKVFDNVSGNWVQKGNSIEGSNYERFGFSVAMSYDGNTIASSAIGSNAGGACSNCGVTRVYVWNGTSWNQIGNDIQGETNDEFSGSKIAISDDGKRIIIGSPTYSAPSFESNGCARVYELISNNWVKMGATLGGKSYNKFFGASVSINYNGTIVGISDPRENDGATYQGVIRTYKWDAVNSDWSTLGDSILGNINANFGNNISLASKVNEMAVSLNFFSSSGFVDNGAVNIYQLKGGNWVLKGNPIIGDRDSLYFGHSVSLNDDGNKLIVGTITDTNGTNTGYAQAYNWDGNNWVAYGNKILGEKKDDNFGQDVVINKNGHMVIIHANSQGRGDSVGYVCVYEYCKNSRNTIRDSICASLLPYTWQGVVFTQSDTQDVVLTNSQGCDSILTLILKVKPTRNTSFSRTSCGYYQWNDSTYYVSGIYQQYFTSSDGCDSIISLNLTVVNNNIDANFAASTQLFSNNLVRIVNISNARTDSVRWVLPNHAGITVLRQNKNFIELKFKDSGTYQFGMVNNNSICEKEIFKELYVYPHDSMAYLPSNFGPFIRNFEIFPNPSIGTFTCLVELSNVSDIHMRIVAIDNYAVFDDRTFTGDFLYEVPYNLSINPGVYLLILDTSQGSLIQKIIIN